MEVGGSGVKWGARRSRSSLTIACIRSWVLAIVVWSFIFICMQSTCGCSFPFVLVHFHWWVSTFIGGQSPPFVHSWLRWWAFMFSVVVWLDPHGGSWCSGWWCGCYGVSWCFIVVCSWIAAMSLTAMWLLLLLCKWERGRGRMLLTWLLSVACHPCMSPFIHCWLPHHCWRCGPCFLFEKRRGRKTSVTHCYVVHHPSLSLSSICYWLLHCWWRRGPCFSCEHNKREKSQLAYLNSCGQWRRLVSSLSRRCGMSIDMPKHLHPIKTMCVHIVVTVRLSLGSIHLAGDVVLPHCSHCWGGWMVGGGCYWWWWRWSRGGGWWWLRKKFFVCLWCACEFSANTASAAQYKERMVAYMIYYINSY